MVCSQDSLWDFLRSMKQASAADVHYLPGNIVTLLKMMGSAFVGEDFSRLYLAGANFAGTDLQHANFTDSTLVECDFSNTNLSNSVFRRAEFKDTSWGENGAVYTVDSSPDDKNVAAGIQGEGIRVWTLDSGRPLSSFSVGDTVYATRFSPRGHYLVCVTRSGNILAWHTSSGKQVFQGSDRNQPIESFCFGFDEVTIFYTTAIGIQTVNIISEKKAHVDVPNFVKPRNLTSSHYANLLAASGADGLVAVIRGTSYEPLLVRHLHQGSVRGIDLNPQGNFLATGGKDGRIVLTSLPDGKQIAAVQLETPVFSVAIRPQDLR